MNRQNAPDLSIIIVNYNGADLLYGTCVSLFATDCRVTFHTLLVDNGSTDGSLARVKRDFPAVEIIENGANLGFARANNLALARAQGRYPLLLNPDIEVLPGAFDALVAFMDANPEVGLAGPKLLNLDRTLQHSCRRFSTPAHLLIRGLHLDRFMEESSLVKDAVYADWDHATERDVDYVTGAAMIVRREALAQVGLLDEGFTLYFEDQDWCYRMWQQGWRVAYAPQAQMVHNHQRASARGLFSKSKRIHVKSMVRFFRKHYLPSPLGLRVEEQFAALPASTTPGQ